MRVCVWVGVCVTELCMIVTEGVYIIKRIVPLLGPDAGLLTCLVNTCGCRAGHLKSKSAMIEVVTCSYGSFSLLYHSAARIG